MPAAQVGMPVISRWIKPGTIDTLDYYNHFSLLASLENLFGLGKLGYATSLSLQAFPASVFSGAGPS